jgi:transglutaminase/protease-like cytokinesis protein 3
MNAAERATAKQQLDTVIQNIIEQAPDNSDDFETELYLHEQLTVRCTYDHDAATKGYDYNPHAYTIFGALVNGKAVCEGYSRAMQLLLKNVDIPSTLVVGKSAASGEQHMWNMVTINGQNYHLDATWNDTNDNNRHNYFNVTTQQISISHRIETDQLGIDTCSATTDNYYVKQGLYLDTYRRQEIAAVIAECIRNGDTQIELFFAADKFDSALLFLKSRSTTEAMVNAHLANSTLTLWEYTLYGETDEHILYMKKKQ